MVKSDKICNKDENVSLAEDERHTVHTTGGSGGMKQTRSMEETMEYFAKSENSQGHQETVKEHLQKVAALALTYGEPMGMRGEAELAGQVHDFGKYSEEFRKVLAGKCVRRDHALGGACFLEGCYRGSVDSRPVVEAVNGHHDGLVAYDMILFAYLCLINARRAVIRPSALLR